MAEPSRQLGTYLSRRVRSGGQGAKKGVCGALEVAEFAATILSPKDISILGESSEDATVGRSVEVALKEDVVGGVPFPQTKPLERERCWL